MLQHALNLLFCGFLWVIHQQCRDILSYLRFLFYFSHFAECCREASFLHAKLDCNVCLQCIHYWMGFGGWIWAWRMGQHDQLDKPNWHIWTFCQMLPMPWTTATCWSTTPSYPSSGGGRGWPCRTMGTSKLVEDYLNCHE